VLTDSTRSVTPWLRSLATGCSRWEGPPGALAVLCRLDSSAESHSLFAGFLRLKKRQQGIPQVRVPVQQFLQVGDATGRGVLRVAAQNFLRHEPVHCRPEGGPGRRTGTRATAPAGAGGAPRTRRTRRASWVLLGRRRAPGVPAPPVGRMGTARAESHRPLAGKGRFVRRPNSPEPAGGPSGTVSRTGP